MKTSDLSITILEPSNSDNWLTNSEVFSKKVYLGKNDTADNWQEITNADKEKAEQEQLERLNQGGDDI